MKIASVVLIFAILLTAFLVGCTESGKLPDNNSRITQTDNKNNLQNDSTSPTGGGTVGSEDYNNTDTNNKTENNDDLVEKTESDEDKNQTGNKNDIPVIQEKEDGWSADV